MTLPGKPTSYSTPHLVPYEGPLVVDYDCEFIEEPGRRDLISIGLVGPDEKTYYAVNSKIPVGRIRRHPWLMANVVPHLPGSRADLAHPRRPWPRRPRLFAPYAPEVKPPQQIAAEGLNFLRSYPRGCELYGWCPAFDHVVLAWLWGTMADPPEGVPWCTRDIGQDAARLGVDLKGDQAPPRLREAHHSLGDAWHQRHLRHWLAEVEAARGR
ncbi:hypothetical protein AB0C52_36060 [Streptomyces sp. NPDC048717]|uniref:hypothetical protein n=1 Tax=Streptomyces sp. NPDC048717 TaxID=3154928 RepID=UPI0034247CA4